MSGTLGRRDALIGGAAAALLTMVPRAAFSAPPAAKWRMAKPLPAAMGEIVGVTVGTRLYVFSGLNDAAGSVPYGASYRYDAETDGWATLKEMPEPAHHVMATQLDGQIYLFGGFNAPGGRRLVWQPTGSGWRYDPASDTWHATAPLPRPRGAGYAVSFAGKIYVIGGVCSHGDGADHTPIPLGSKGSQTVTGWVDEYDPATNSWRPRADMPTPRNHFFAGEVGGRIYALDGRTGSVFVNNASITDLVEAYDPAANTWALVGRAPTMRGDVNGAVLNGELVVTGGEFHSEQAKMAFWGVEAYSPASETWRTLPHLQIARHGFACAFMGNDLHVVGGSFQSDGMPGVYSPTATHEVLTLA